MDERQHMRASDQDREEVVGHLRAALDEGRLKMPEYVERMGLAYDAVTYADLAPLHADLPAATGLARPAPAPVAAAAPQPSPVVVPQRADHMPTALKVLWTIWLTAVSINVVVWFLVSVTSGHAAYPWPLWVAGPAGAALFGVTYGTAQIRRSRRPGPPGPSPAPGPSGSPR
ncbi:MAG TPA: DUF1707 domain-containing protein [Streptosporangiaceae bacterium]